MYEPTVPILDARIEVTLLVIDGDTRKRIVLQENHSHLILEKKDGVYPPSLLKLLRFIQEKSRALRKATEMRSKVASRGLSSNTTRRTVFVSSNATTPDRHSCKRSYPAQQTPV
jgi:hypothetical protein